MLLVSSTSYSPLIFLTFDVCRVDYYQDKKDDDDFAAQGFLFITHYPIYLLIIFSFRRDGGCVGFIIVI